MSPRSHSQPLIPPGLIPSLSYDPRPHSQPLIPPRSRSQPLMPPRSHSQPLMPPRPHSQPLMPPRPHSQPLMPSSLAVWNARASNENWGYERLGVRLNLFSCHVTEQGCKLEIISERCGFVISIICLYTCTYTEGLRSAHGFVECIKVPGY